MICAPRRVNALGRVGPRFQRQAPSRAPASTLLVYPCSRARRGTPTARAERTSEPSTWWPWKPVAERTKSCEPREILSPFASTRRMLPSHHSRSRPRSSSSLAFSSWSSRLETKSARFPRGRVRCSYASASSSMGVASWPRDGRHRHCHLPRPALRRSFSLGLSKAALQVGEPAAVGRDPGRGGRLKAGITCRRGPHLTRNVSSANFT